MNPKPFSGVEPLDRALGHPATPAHLDVLGPVAGPIATILPASARLCRAAVGHLPRWPGARAGGASSEASSGSVRRGPAPTAPRRWSTGRPTPTGPAAAGSAAVAVRAGRDPAQHVADAGGRVRLQHAGHRGEVGGDVLQRALGDLQGDERLDGEPGGGQVDVGAVAGDDAGVLQPLQPRLDRAAGHAELPGQLQRTGLGCSVSASSSARSRVSSAGPCMLLGDGSQLVDLHSNRASGPAAGRSDHSDGARCAVGSRCAGCPLHPEPEEQP